MSSTTVTLAEVANQFQLWRDKQNSKFSPIPIHLKDQARQLLRSHSTSQVAAALNISRSALYSIKKDKNCSLVSNNQTSEVLNFIPINFAEPNQPQKNQPLNLVQPTVLNLTCEIIKPNGMRLIIHTSDPTNIISA